MVFCFMWTLGLWRQCKTAKEKNTFSYNMLSFKTHLLIVVAINRSASNNNCNYLGIYWACANSFDQFELFIIIFVRIWRIFIVYQFMFTTMFVFLFLTLPSTIHLISGTSGNGFSKKWIHISHFWIYELWKIPIINNVLKIIDY